MAEFLTKVDDTVGREALTLHNTKQQHLQQWLMTQAGGNDCTVGRKLYKLIQHTYTLDNITLSQRVNNHNEAWVTLPVSLVSTSDYKPGIVNLVQRQAAIADNSAIIDRYMRTANEIFTLILAQ